jgi:hypothetical protein
MQRTDEKSEERKDETKNKRKRETNKKPKKTEEGKTYINNTYIHTYIHTWIYRPRTFTVEPLSYMQFIHIFLLMFEAFKFTFTLLTEIYAVFSLFIVNKQIYHVPQRNEQRFISCFAVALILSRHVTHVKVTNVYPAFLSADCKLANIGLLLISDLFHIL